jgi:uncharacterized protein YjbI with pentapeptide repeats/DNA-binding XRE family transcriptional regulator
MEAQAQENLFPKFIKELRTGMGLTQTEFGQLFEPPVTHQSVGQWERGENAPAKRYWSKLAELARMDLGQFSEYFGDVLTYTPSYLEEIVQKIKNLKPNDLEVIIQATADKWGELDAVKPTANKQHLALLKKGTAAWNRWRERNPEIRPKLYRMNLSRLGYPDLEGANFSGADLREAQLDKANLVGANLFDCDLSGADLKSANLSKADLSKANLKGANLSDSWLVSANLHWANLSAANLKGANLNEANLKQTNLSEADLTFADLRWALLVETNLEGAILKQCSVYGASVWEAKLDRAEQSRLNTSTEGDIVSSKNTVRVNNLQLAQIIHAISNDPQLYQTLRQRFEDEAAAEKCARLLLSEYGQDGQDGSRLYSDRRDGSYEIIEDENTLRVMAVNRSEPLILLLGEERVYSNLAPDDVGNLEALIKFESDLIFRS